MSYLTNLDPTPAEYSTDAAQAQTVPIRWLMLEAQRIRRERIQRRIEAGIATACLIVWGVVILNAVRLMIR